MSKYFASISSFFKALFNVRSPLVLALFCLYFLDVDDFARSSIKYLFSYNIDKLANKYKHFAELNGTREAIAGSEVNMVSTFSLPFIILNILVRAWFALKSSSKIHLLLDSHNYKYSDVNLAQVLTPVRVRSKPTTCVR